MKNKKTLIAIAAIIAVGAIGATIAYNMDSISFNNLFHVSTYQSQTTESFTSPNDWKPCDVTSKDITVKNTGSIAVAARVKLDQYWRNAADTANLPMLTDSNDAPLTTINFSDGWNTYWEKSGDWYVYKTDLAPGETAHKLIDSVTLECAANLTGSTVYTNNNQTGETGTSEYAGAHFHVNATIQTIQADAKSQWSN